jgi:LysM repeat protein
VHVEPGKELSWAFTFNTDPRTERALILRNGKYFITHPGLAKTHGIASYVTNVSIIIHGAEDAPMVRAPTRAVHVVRKGETLWSIASRYFGNGQGYIKIYQANIDIIRDETKLHQGLRLKIPNL